MESLIGYGSDDENEDLSQHKKQSSSQADVNYEEVQMDLSEESNDSSKLESRRPSLDHYHSRSRDGNSDLRNKEYSEKNLYKKSEDHKYKYERDRYSPKYQENKKEDRYRERDRDRNKYDDEKTKSRDEKLKDDRSRDYKKDKYREDKGKFKDEKVRESRKNKEEQDKGRGYDSRDNSRDDRRPHRTSSRDRHRSRSPRRSDYKSKRSSSRDRSHSGYSKRCDRTSSKMDRLERLGIELNTSNPGFASTSSNLFTNDKDQDKDRFYMPGITGRFTEQIQRRKLLWQKKEPKAAEAAEGSTSTATETSGVPPQTTKIWQNTTFAQDTDGKVANKFKRLMGIKGNESEAVKPPNDNLKKQEEMFNSMEAQYEVARTATHTMRGVGLGFGSFQR